MFSIIKSGMDTALHELSMISNNISNANSTGFKKSSVAFSEFYNGRTAEGVDSALVGLGANSEDARRSDAQGALVEMGGALDTAIVGNGYFMTQHPDQVGFSVTRNGAFSLDSDGFLVSQDGDFVLGMTAVEGEFVRYCSEFRSQLMNLWIHCLALASKITVIFWLLLGKVKIVR